MNSGTCNPGLEKLQMISGLQGPGTLPDEAKLRVRDPLICGPLPSEDHLSTSCFACRGPSKAP